MSEKRKKIQTIKDPLLDPYFITRDEYSFAVKEMVKSDATHFRSKGKSKVYEKSHYYFSKFDQALSKIATLKSGDGDFDNLEEYINNYQQISNQIKSYTDGIKSQV